MKRGRKSVCLAEHGIEPIILLPADLDEDELEVMVIIKSLRTDMENAQETCFKLKSNHKKNEAIREVAQILNQYDGQISEPSSISEERIWGLVKIFEKKKIKDLFAIFIEPDIKEETNRTIDLLSTRVKELAEA